MNKTNFVVLLLICLINFRPVEAKMTKFKGDKSKKSAFEILKQNKINAEDVSLQITQNGKEISSVNAQKSLIPASISKVFTSFGILKKFPPGHKFYTKLYTDSKNLYLKGGGDPSFVSENMWFLVNEFNRTGIKNIKGDIIVDESLFDDIRYDESRESTRVDRAYDSPVGAMSFNWNAVNVYVKPSSVGQKARVVIDPDNNFFDLVNSTMTVSGPPKKELVISISNVDRLITVTGEVPAAVPEKAYFKPVENPAIWSGANLKFFLSQRGITVDGKVKIGKVPIEAEVVAVSESKNLSYIMADMNKFSNNYVAEMLTKGLAALAPDEPASLRRGVNIIRGELQKIGLDERKIIYKNPSGLTRENSFSAGDMNKVLIEIQNDFSIYPAFADSLPIAGIDGTLKKRFKNTLAEGRVRAKTGYLTGVVTLAGYAGRRDGSVLTFSFLYNGPRDEAIVRETFDQILLNNLN